MLKRQVWMADDNEFDHVVKNSQRVLKLNVKYDNHQYVEEFTKGCNVMLVYGTYDLEGEADAKFSLDDIWKLFHKDPLQNNASNFCRQMIKACCMKAWDYLQKTSDLPLNTEISRKAHGLMMEDELFVLAGEYRRLPVFAGYHVFALAGYVERYMEGAIFRLHKTKKDDPVMAATNLFGNITNIHPFEDGNRRICHLILAVFLSCLFPVILSSFHRRGRRHYISPVKMFDRIISMLYTMIVKSLVHCWNNFEQNAKMLSPTQKCW